jgi:hypothetical protein
VENVFGSWRWKLFLEQAPRTGGSLCGACYNEKFTPQGRSSVVEQRPFKPKVVGSIPTAPTNT